MCGRGNDGTAPGMTPSRRPRASPAGLAEPSRFMVRTQANARKRERTSSARAGRSQAFFVDRYGGAADTGIATELSSDLVHAHVRSGRARFDLHCYSAAVCREPARLHVRWSAPSGVFWPVQNWRLASARVAAGICVGTHYHLPKAHGPRGALGRWRACRGGARANWPQAALQLVDPRCCHLHWDCSLDRLARAEVGRTEVASDCPRSRSTGRRQRTAADTGAPRIRRARRTRQHGLARRHDICGPEVSASARGVWRRWRAYRHESGVQGPVTAPAGDRRSGTSLGPISMHAAGSDTFIDTSARGRWHASAGLGE